MIKIEDPILFGSPLSIAINFTAALNALISTTEPPYLCRDPISSPSYSMTLGPLPFQAQGCKTRTPHRTPQTAEASRLRPGQRVAAGESERLARGKRWEEKTLGAETGLGATCGTSAGATPVLAMAARHLGAPGALAAVLGTPTLPRPRSPPL